MVTVTNNMAMCHIIQFASITCPISSTTPKQQQFIDVFMYLAHVHLIILVKKYGSWPINSDVIPGQFIVACLLVLQLLAACRAIGLIRCMNVWVYEIMGLWSYWVYRFLIYWGYWGCWVFKYIGCMGLMGLWSYWVEL